MKRQKFEDKLGVPDSERLHGEGWLRNFCKTYKIKEHRRHGEAGSVDMEAVKEECLRVQGILEQYAIKDRFNFDETGLFALYVFFPSARSYLINGLSSATPDRGLTLKQMSGKKQDKFRITLGVACNADGS